MTAFTPQQMRELSELGWMPDDQVRAALRTAADQLEAVGAWNWRHEGLFVNQDVESILTADTASEGRAL